MQTLTTMMTGDTGVVVARKHWPGQLCLAGVPIVPPEAFRFAGSMPTREKPLV